MLFVIICTDKPNSLDLRLSTRPVHVDFLYILRRPLSSNDANPLLRKELTMPA